MRDPRCGMPDRGAWRQRSLQRKELGCGHAPRVLLGMRTTATPVDAQCMQRGLALVPVELGDA
jgi:hypothetical protein